LLDDIGFVWNVERGSQIAQLQRVSVVGLKNRKSGSSKSGDNEDDEQNSDSSTTGDPPGSSRRGDNHNLQPSLQQQQQSGINPFAALPTSLTAQGGLAMTPQGSAHAMAQNGQTFGPFSTNATGMGMTSPLQMVGPSSAGNSTNNGTGFFGAMNPYLNPFLQGAGMGTGTGPFAQNMLPLQWLQQAGLSQLQQGLMQGASGIPQQVVFLAVPPNAGGIFLPGMAALAGAGAGPSRTSQSTSLTDSSDHNGAANAAAAIGGTAGTDATNSNTGNGLNNLSAEQVNAASALIFSALATAQAGNSGSGSNDMAAMWAAAMGQQQTQAPREANMGNNSGAAASEASAGGGALAHGSTFAGHAADTGSNTNATANLGSNNNTQMPQLDATATLAAFLGGAGGMGGMNASAANSNLQQMAATLGMGSSGRPSHRTSFTGTTGSFPSSGTMPAATNTTTTHTTTALVSAPSLASTRADPPAHTAGTGGTLSGDPMGILAAALSQYFRAPTTSAPAAATSAVQPQAQQAIPGSITVTSGRSSNAQQQQQENTATGDGTGDGDDGSDGGRPEKRSRYP